MKIQDIRYQNLQALLNETGGNQAELARRTGTNAAYINQIINRSHLPSGKIRAVGERLARKLEQAFKKPDGWMDSATTGLQLSEPAAIYEPHSTAVTKLMNIASKLSRVQLELACRMLEGLIEEPDEDNS